jgi:hypothetical protein
MVIHHDLDKQDTATPIYTPFFRLFVTAIEGQRLRASLKIVFSLTIPFKNNSLRLVLLLVDIRIASFLDCLDQKCDTILYRVLSDRPT